MYPLSSAEHFFYVDPRDRLRLWAKGMTGEALLFLMVGGKLVALPLELGASASVLLLLLRLSSCLAALVPLLGATERPLAPADEGG